MNLDGMGERIREIAADILIQNKMVWVDYGGHIYVGRTTDGLGEVDISATDLFKLVNAIMLHPEINPTVIARKLSDDGLDSIRSEVCRHLLNDGHFSTIKWALQRRFVEHGKASGILVHPVFPDTKAMAMRIMDDCAIIETLVDSKHQVIIKALRQNAWGLVDITDPMTEQDESE